MRGCRSFSSQVHVARGRRTAWHASCSCLHCLMLHQGLLERCDTDQDMPIEVPENVLNSYCGSAAYPLVVGSDLCDRLSRTARWSQGRSTGDRFPNTLVAYSGLRRGPPLPPGGPLIAHTLSPAFPLSKDSPDSIYVGPTPIPDRAPFRNVVGRPIATFPGRRASDGLSPAPLR